MEGLYLLVQGQLGLAAVWSQIFIIELKIIIWGGIFDRVTRIGSHLFHCFFFVKGLEEAEGYFGRKVDLVTKQLELLQPKLIEKHKMRQGMAYV